VNPICQTPAIEEKPMQTPRFAAQVSGVLAVLAVMSLLLLTTRVFYTALFLTACCVVSLALWLPLAIGRSDRRLASAVVALHVFLLGLIGIALPVQYREQTRYDRAIENVKRRHEAATDPQEEVTEESQPGEPAQQANEPESNGNSG